MRSMSLHLFKLARAFWWLALMASLSFTSVYAQTPPAQSNQEKPAKEDQLETFKVDVSVVNILFNVKDKHGALIPGLKRDDFELFEDGQKQTIKYFAAETDLPLTL